MSNYPKQEAYNSKGLEDAPPQYSSGYTSQEMNKQPNQPPPPVYVMGQPQPAYVQPTVVFVPTSIQYGAHPVNVQCPNCRANVLSDTKYETGAVTWLIAGGFCLLGLWLGCCLIPFCVDACKDVEHYCPNCKTMLGRYRKL